MKRWEDMSRDELVATVQREHGHRLSLSDDVKRLREVTKDKRDLLALAEQLQDEIQRLETQNDKWMRNAFENQVRLKRALKERLDVALAGLRLALLWLRYFDGDGPEPAAPVADVLAAWDEATAKRGESGATGAISEPPKQDVPATDDTSSQDLSHLRIRGGVDVG